jgi:hypothetical protein
MIVNRFWKLHISVVISGALNGRGIVYGTISEIYALWQYKSPFNLHHLQTSGEQNPNNTSLIPTKKIIWKWHMHRIPEGSVNKWI